ncbi:MAG TPA: extracellular solute-binding protein [Candidatus Acidoferrales bacterium]|nr:extracellular solute-binding protein [Candidatus Acidoferrales bacterium]
MKQGSRTCPLIVGLLLYVLNSVSLAAPAPAAFGRSFDEIVALAKKEGRVLIGSGLAEEEAKTVLGAFMQKYPEIRVENTRLRTPEHKMKVFNELVAGRVEFDVLDISSELMDQFKKAGVVSGPFEWRALFTNAPKDHFSPDGYFAAGAYGLKPIAYNPDLVPPERIPKDWADCTDPYWKGRFVVDTSAKYVVTLYPGWGEEKLLSWARRIKDNQPIWKRGMSEAIVQLAAGEFHMICGVPYQSVHRVLRRDPKARVAVSWPKEVSATITETMGVLKGAKHPNAGLLLAGWLASPEAQQGYDKLGRGSPFLEGTEAWQLVRAHGSRVIFAGWDLARWENEMMNKIHAAWGLRK